MFKKILGALIIVGGIVAAIWLGFIVMLVGGIEQFVNGVTAHPVDSGDIAWGTVRFFLSGAVFAVVVIVVPALGGVLWEEGKRDQARARLQRRFDNDNMRTRRV